MTLRIREAEPRDLASIVDLVGQLGYPSDEPAVTQRLERLSADPSSWVHVALEGGRVVGLAAVYVMPLIERDDPIARVTTIVVDHGARGRGIGRALLARLEERARARGCDRIDLTSRYDREGAAPFYRRMAFEDTSSRFVKGLN